MTDDRHHSAGGVALVPFGRQIMVATILVPGGAVALPKGTPEPGESDPETALREVAEETGLRCAIRDSLGETEYRFRGRGGRLIEKTVSFYLMTYRAGSPAHHDHEVEGVRLIPIQRAGQTLTYPGERDIFGRALASLRGPAGAGSAPANSPAET